MLMWAIIIAVIVAVLILSIFYIINRFTRFRFIDYIEDKTIFISKPRDRVRAVDLGISAKKKYLEEHPDQKKYKPKKSWLRILIALILFIIIYIVLALCLNNMEAVIILINTLVIWAIVEGIFAIIRICGLDLTVKKVYIPGIVAIILSAVYMSIAGYLGANPVIKNYEIDTAKNVEPLRIVQFSDSHLGVVLNKDTFPKEVEKIKAQNPDMVVITGDYVDENSSYEDMVSACQALSTIDCKYGVYYSFGNHDKGRLSSNNNRGYDSDELVKVLTDNNVKVLEDQIDIIDNQYILIGRADKSDKSRKSIQDLVATVNPEDYNKDYSIVLNHQPNDYKNESDAGIDLVLSGHTHGGQMLPVNRIGELIGANDATYGFLTIKNTDFIVSSGISSWGFRFKTGTRSEIVVIDIK